MDHARYGVPCASLQLAGQDLMFVAAVKYLGVYLVASKCFKCSVDHVKLKFYPVFNSIYAKSQRSEIVTVELMKSYCIPFILYATEALRLLKGILNMLDNCINKALCKIFKVHTSDCIVSLRNFLHLPKLEINIENRRSKFIHRLLSVEKFTVLFKIQDMDLLSL